MIISQNINPKRNLYYIGSLIIEIIEKYGKTISIHNLFENLNKNKKDKISYSLFVLTLDWLFLLNIIKMNENNIKICL
ncbi:MAG: hypothetical protein QJQ54_00265 [Mollicutes bacterium]|nr:MAG: hypothetical protein QJQ54_00265 [Mollicutes bacterium]